METKQNPFSVYDFLGYLIPGAAFIYAVLLAFDLVGWDMRVWLTQRGAIIHAPSLYVSFAICAYIVGHALSFLSSLIVERYAIWAYGYPSRFLTKDRPASYLEGIPSDDFEKQRRAVRRIFYFIGTPYTVLDDVLHRYFRVRDLFAKCLDSNNLLLLQRKIWIFLGTELGIFRYRKEEAPGRNCMVNLNNQDYFRAIYHYVLEHFPAHVPSLKNYVALYGFLRTFTLLFTFLFWLLAILAVRGWVLLAFESSWAACRSACFFSCASIVVAGCCYVFFLAFIKFYKRYTLEAFMAFAANYSVEPPGTEADRYAAKLVSLEK